MHGEKQRIMEAYDRHDVFLLQSTLHHFPDAEGPKTVMSLAAPWSVHHRVVESPEVLSKMFEQPVLAPLSPAPWAWAVNHLRPAAN